MDTRRETPNALSLVRLPSPLGDLRILLEGEHLVRIGLPGLDSDPLPGPGGPLLSQSSPSLAAAVAAWFRGEEELLAAFPRHVVGTPCYQKVWEVTGRIPRGELRTYKEVALAAGLGPHGARAVGGALRANPLPLVVPCHRVLGAGLRLTGFGGSGRAGLALKRRLLEREGILCAPGS